MERVVADRGGLDDLGHSKELVCRTSDPPPLEAPRENPPVTNCVPGQSSGVKYVLGCIAALDEYDISNLAWWLSSDDGELEQNILQQACDTREIHGTKSLFSITAEEYRSGRSEGGHLEPDDGLDDDYPDFDDPDFLAKLHTDSAPLPDRKRLFIRLWKGFESVDRKAFLTRLYPQGAFQQATT